MFSPLLTDRLIEALDEETADSQVSSRLTRAYDRSIRVQKVSHVNADREDEAKRRTAPVVPKPAVRRAPRASKWVLQRAPIASAWPPSINRIQNVHRPVQHAVLAADFVRRHPSEFGHLPRIARRLTGGNPRRPAVQHQPPVVLRLG